MNACIEPACRREGVYARLMAAATPEEHTLWYCAEHVPAPAVPRYQDETVRERFERGAAKAWLATTLVLSVFVGLFAGLVAWNSFNPSGFGFDDSGLVVLAVFTGIAVGFAFDMVAYALYRIWAKR